MTLLEPQFAAGFRDQLIDTARGTSALAIHTRRHRFVVGVAAGAAAAALLTAGALVAAGLIPGEHVVTPVGSGVTESHTGTATVDLGARPDTANAVSLTLTCTSAGTFTLADGFMVCGVDAPIGNTMHVADLPLVDGATSFTVEASPGATWTVTAHYVNTVTTDWGVNANGQTYGTPNEKGVPDLISVQATNEAIGYSYWSDFMSHGDEGDTFPVYESDGTTVIGEFYIGSD